MDEFNGFEEAKRCLSCKTPRCQTGCPTNMQIRDFIKCIKEDNLLDAAKIIRNCSSLSTICSVVCPHERQCVGHCILNIKKSPINVGRLEQFVFDNFDLKDEIEHVCNKCVAIIGTGPSSIACALELAIKGVKVTMFEKEPHFGGVLSYGIPNFRLELSRVQKLEERLINLGVKIIYNKEMSEKEIIELKNDYDDIFIGVGLTNVRKLNIKNEEMPQVHNALEFLKKANYYFKYNDGEKPILKGTTIVVGAGNVAMDASRMALRCESEKVIIVYRRSLEEAPANKIEIEEAKEDGVEFKFLTNPSEVIVENNKVVALKCEIMTLGEADESGRKKPISTNEFITIPCDNVISAIGQIPSPLFKNGFKNNNGYLVCDEVNTSIDNIYAGGDIVLGAKTVVEAQRTGRNAAKAILNS